MPLIRLPPMVRTITPVPFRTLLSDLTWSPERGLAVGPRRHDGLSPRAEPDQAHARHAHGLRAVPPRVGVAQFRDRSDAGAGGGEPGRAPTQGHDVGEPAR
ncbi:hypothetical protein GCM10009838_23460 [Catenulispora subtropica]|uniref:Uncharacterized protein n=1 Tax=Catenulispora subtropica TaxID=450798 RepID=A0ABP5CK99_9ACTN